MSIIVCTHTCRSPPPWNIGVSDIDILDDHHQYVPYSSVMAYVDVPGEEECESIRLDSFQCILYYGDQLTVEHMRGAQAVRSNSENGIQQLKGFVPAVPDWHAKVSFLGLSGGEILNTLENFYGIYFIFLDNI